MQKFYFKKRGDLIRFLSERLIGFNLLSEPDTPSVAYSLLGDHLLFHEHCSEELSDGMEIYIEHSIFDSKSSLLLSFVYFPGQSGFDFRMDLRLFTIHGFRPNLYLNGADHDIV